MTADTPSPDEKQQIVNNVIYRYSTTWIYSLESEEHWRHYWHQQKIMQGFVQPGDHVLEIGVGSGFTANYLRSKGIRVTTIDIDKEKKPDIVANIVTYDFGDQTYDHIIAFEVLEHLPFEQVEKLLPKLSSICNQMMFISVPMNRAIAFQLSMKLPKLRQVSWVVTRKLGRISSPHHFWEVDFQSFTRQRLESIFIHSNFHIRNAEVILATYLFYALSHR